MKLFENKEIAMIQAMNVCLALLVAPMLLIDPKLAVQLMAFVGTCWLATLLIIPRLLHVKAFARWHENILQVARNSKWVGTWTGIWFLSHAITAFVVHVHSASWHSTMQTLLSPQIAFGLLSALVFCLLLAISNKWSYQHVKWWKHLNMLIWLVVPLAFTHALLASTHFLGSLPFATVLVLFPAIIVAGVSGVMRKKRDYFAEFRLLLLAIGLVAGLLLTFLTARA